jgi:hypothetical protein
MKLTVSVNHNGRRYVREADSFTQMGEFADEWHAQGMKPVRFYRDHEQMHDADELARLIDEEKEAD